MFFALFNLFIISSLLSWFVINGEACVLVDIRLLDFRDITGRTAYVP